MAEDVRKVLKGEAMPMELFTFRDVLSGYTPPGTVDGLHLVPLRIFMMLNLNF